ncbi:phage tail fiber protein [Psychrobacter sp.]|uniref:phage tail fiber protein n=1 Tax=Psychrobacter sp. TaxID=56811 RepID=UPI002FDB547C
MAVQIPDPGTGNGQTGDNEYVFRKKVKDNFSDQTNAASRLVGTTVGRVPEFTPTAGIGGTGLGGYILPPITIADASTKAGFFSGEAGPAFARFGGEHVGGWVVNRGSRPIVFFFGNQAELKMTHYSGISWSNTAAFWTSNNATKDSNGFLKASSPIVKVFADKVELNDDAVNQNVTYKKNGIGDYTITTQSGLSTDGWYIELPKDMNGNPKVAVTLQETNGVISLKSYKRIFSMETFTFEPDLEQPLDIPDGRWIDLRLNEIPVEPSELETEV